MEKEKRYKIFYGENDNEYVTRYLKEEDIINGYLSEAKAFEIFYTDMIMCNNYFSHCNYDNINALIDEYDEESDSYIDVYQNFIINIEYDKDITIKATEKMGNTLFYDNDLGIYITGITDLGTNRQYVPTDLKVEEVTD